MKRLLALIRREYWENKGALRTTPLVIGGIYIVFLLMSIFTTAHFDNEMYTFREAVRLLAEQPAEFRATHGNEVILGSSLFFSLVLSFVVFFSSPLAHSNWIIRLYSFHSHFISSIFCRGHSFAAE